VVAEFQKHGVVALMADWTNRDPKIGAYLKEHYKRSNIPVNVIYSPDPDAPPLILPELLSQDHVKDGIRLMAEKQAAK
jgi:thiol:disulfide interchange protein